MIEKTFIPLVTPLGEIKVIADKKEVIYEYKECKNIRNAENATCYQITVNTNNSTSVSCILDFHDCEIEAYDEHGEKMLCKSFEKCVDVVSIGALDYDELEETGIYSGVLNNGLIFDIEKNKEYVEFKVAWVTDYYGVDDIRTWFAVDPL